MPFVSQAQRKYMFAKHPAIAKEFAAKTPKGAKLPEHVKKMPKLKVDNKMKGSYGETELVNNKAKSIKINVKAHKGDKAELASTIKHELTHAKYPKMTEKEVYKRTAKTKIPLAEQRQLLKKLKVKQDNYKQGAFKGRLTKYKNEKSVPGSLITKLRNK